LKSYDSPLRYPGGKSKLLGYIENVISCNHLAGCDFYEPFAGGAAITIGLLQKGTITSSTIIERDPLVFAFWYAVFFRTDELVDRIDETPITIDTWDKIKKYKSYDLPSESEISDMGFAGLFLNRTNFSGVLNAGPIGGHNQTGKYKIDCRFNKSRLIETIRFLALYKDRVTVSFSDGIIYLQNAQYRLLGRPSFVYVDPPYYNKGSRLYRHYFSNTEHVNLSNVLRNAQYPWLLSYDNCSFINELYQNQNNDLKRKFLYFDYSCNNVKKETELLISNLEIPPVEQFGLLSVV